MKSFEYFVLSVVGAKAKIERHQLSLPILTKDIVLVLQ